MSPFCRRWTLEATGILFEGTLTVSPIHNILQKTDKLLTSRDSYDNMRHYRQADRDPTSTEVFQRQVQAKCSRKFMKWALCLLVLVLMLSVSAVTSPIAADVGVEVNGSHVRDYTVVNGTAVISFWVHSEAVVSSVAVSYLGQNKEWASANMSLTEGDVCDGWWEATIKPNVLKEEVEGEIKYRLDVRTLHVSSDDRIVDIDVSGFLGSVSTKQKHESTFFLSIPMLWAICIVGGIPVALLVVAVVLMAYHRTT